MPKLAAIVLLLWSCNAALAWYHHGTPNTATVYLSAVNTLNNLAATTIPNGGSAILTWDSHNAASCAGTGFSTGTAVSGTASVAPTTSTTYSVNCGGASTAVTVTVSGTLRQPATDGTCAANGGGSGTSASPWRAACIQAAVNAASSGDTIFLAGGNWTLNTDTDALVSIRKAITLSGAGSGNSFDVYGHINNASGTSPCPTAGTSITCIYQTGTNYSLGTNPNTADAGKGVITFGLQGAIQYSDTGCANIIVSHINVDGSQRTAGGDYFGIMSFKNCAGPVTVQDIRHLTFGNLSISPETQFFSQGSQDLLFRDSMFGNPLFAGSYGWGQAFEPVISNRITFINNAFWQGTLNSTTDESLVYIGNSTNTSIVGPVQDQANIGPTGCGLGGQCPTQVGVSNPQGSHHGTFANNYNVGGTAMFTMGAGINDPSTNGNVSDLHYTGNWLFGSKVGMDACVWYLSDVQGNCAGGGMSINAQSDSNCVLSNNGQPYTITNNSLIGTVLAELNAKPGGGTMPCIDPANPSGTPVALQVYNYNAQKNYLSSPSNQAPTNAASFNRTVIGNYCAGSSFTQTDSSSCASTGFTTLPTVAFTLGTLSNGVVAFAATSFTAQYGAVQWLASTNSTAPLSSDTRWMSNNTSAANSYIPPVSLSGVTHGSSVYMWVMDSANNISAAATALVP